MLVTKAPTLVLDRAKAAALRARGKCDVQGARSLFGQTFQQLHGLPPRVLRNAERAWCAAAAGSVFPCARRREAGHGAGSRSSAVSLQMTTAAPTARCAAVAAREAANGVASCGADGVFQTCTGAVPNVHGAHVGARAAPALHSRAE